ncbi:MAG: hypothetical protein GY774_33795 [Planctomycetes bacterium]|nr:hypothetical protein [Planctomycetota bacterium]
MKKALLMLLVSCSLFANAEPAVIEESYTIPGTLSESCDKVDYYSPEQDGEEYRLCLMEVIQLTLDYTKFAPAIITPGMMPEDKRLMYVEEAKKIFTYFNSALSDSERLTVDVDKMMFKGKDDAS